MKNKLVTFIIAMFLMINYVNAETCTLEKQVEVNNAAGAVSATGSPYEYEYVTENSESGEEETFTDYIGTIFIYNLTPDIYAIVDDGTTKQRVNYEEKYDGDALVSTDAMSVVKNYTVSIYAVNTSCNKNAIREINVTIPRLNNYYYDSLCQTYPDYFYCSQFMTVDSISYDDFRDGIAKYASQKKAEDDENRKQGILNETKTFLKKHWLVVLVVIIVLASGITFFIYRKNKKRKEQII